MVMAHVCSLPALIFLNLRFRRFAGTGPSGTAMPPMAGLLPQQCSVPAACPFCWSSMAQVWCHQPASMSEKVLVRRAAGTWCAVLAGLFWFLQHAIRPLVRNPQL